MSSKFGLILSLIFVFIFFLFGGDLIGIQYVYSELDAKSITISYNISKSARCDSEYLSYLENKYGVSIKLANEIIPLYGDVAELVISTSYTPIVISTSVMPIEVKRSTVLGYYG